MTELPTPKNGFWSELKKTVLSALVGAIMMGIPFYFNTSAAIENNTCDISELKASYVSVAEDISDINMKLSISSVEPENNKDHMEEIKEDIRKISDRQDKISERQDKMYDILLDLAHKK